MSSTTKFKILSLILTFSLVLISTIYVTNHNAFAFIIGQSASDVIGQPDFTTITPGSGNSNLNYPTDAAFDSSGNLWVADQANHRILKFPATLTTGMAATVVIGQTSFKTTTPGSGNNKFGTPHSIAFDPSGNLWVADISNNRILKFTAPLTTGMAASDVIGQPDFTTITPGSGNNKLDTPHGIAFDTSGNLWVADTQNSRVLEFVSPATGVVATTVIGQSNFANTTPLFGNSRLAYPHGITFDSSGNLWVADHSHHRILKFPAPLTTGMAATVVIGQTDFKTTTSGSGNNKFRFPHDVAIDSAGNLWVADKEQNRILKFTAPITTGMAATVVIGQPDFTTTTPGSGNSKFGTPHSIVFDSSGNLWVSDRLNHRILEFHEP